MADHITADDGDEWTDYREHIDIDEGDRVRIVMVSDGNEREVTFTAQSGLASETISDDEGFEQETSGTAVAFETDDGMTLTLNINTGTGASGSRVGTVTAPGGRKIADVREAEVL
jgi:hypothetical protein